MGGKYRSVFDIIGPAMIGPSSSHTAGAVAIGRKARQIFADEIKSVRVDHYESFAMTHKGHGTDYALAAGVLGMEPDDSRVPQAVEVARDQGIQIDFIEHTEPSPIHHPNTAILTIKNEHKEVVVAGCSVGGGTIELREIQIDGVTIRPTGPLPMLLTWIQVEQMFTIENMITAGGSSVLKIITQEINQETVLVIYELDKRPNVKVLADLQDACQQVVCL
ncbi:serine dehydratase beta chain [Ligilactobacillus ceti]|uniref:L-serine deaminase n=1 Tax=Ligilactobacillus ceti DSM 22408 TaxID=1122146 RepID=A0A0R2KLM1_9LACO|nr:serine dehydratase beta chain [Ligilactobacillus ceti]KRN90338.1 L-serine dehydratase subunit beta [Ligilactobacillus ceti DSM 22408]